MKRTRRALLSLLVCALLLASCSKYEETSTENSNESAVSNVSEVASEESKDVSADTSEDDDGSMYDFSVLSKEELEQYITLGEYKGFDSEKVVVEITEKDVQKQIDSILAEYGEWKEAPDRAIKDGDQVTMDFIGYLNGEAFEGGTGNDQTIVIGEGKYIDGFEEGLVGAKNGDKISLNLTFPEDYGVETLNGQAVVFDVTIKKVEEFISPELTVEIIKDYTKDEFTEEAPFREDIKNKLYDQTLFEKTYDSIAEYWQKAVDNATVIKYPDGIIDDYVKSYVDYYTQYATMYGVTLEEFLGMSVEKFKKECAEQAEKQYKDRMVFFAAMYAENYDRNIDKDKYNIWLEDQAKHMNATVEMLLSQYSVETLEYTYLYDNFKGYLYESRNETEPSSSEASETTSTESQSEDNK